MNSPVKGRRAALLIAFLLISSLAETVVPVASAAPASYAPLKWLLIEDGSVGDYGDKLGYHQFWLNFMRDLGTPFDVLSDRNITWGALWNASGNHPNYQAFIYAGVDCVSVVSTSSLGCADHHLEPPKSVLAALKRAVSSGTNGIYIASSIEGTSELWGISSVSDSQVDNPITWNVTSAFTAINGSEYVVGFSETSATPARQLVTTGWAGNATMVLDASWAGGSAVAAASVSYGSGKAYFWSGTEGRLSAYREGYQSVFSMQTGDLGGKDASNYQVTQHVRAALFRFVYDAWKYRVQIMPWERRGSAIIFRMDDGYIGQIFNRTYPWATQWNLNLLAREGLAADLTIPVEGGWVTSTESCPLSSRDLGASFPAYTSPGYRSFCSWREGGFTNTAMVFSRLDNISQTVDSGGVSFKSEESQSLTIADGNSSLLRQLKVKISTSQNASFQVKILNPAGSVAWASGVQNSTYSTPTWVTYRPNASFTQGPGIKIDIIVYSGTVTWETSGNGSYPFGSLTSDSSKDADFVVVGGTYWDVVELDLNHSLNWASQPQTTIPGLLMANGATYPAASRTFQFQGFPAPDNVRKFGVDWIKGRTGTSTGPTRLTLVWFVDEAEWQNTLAGKATRSFYNNYSLNYGFGLVLKNRFHHPYQGTTYRGSDYSWNLNSSYFSFDSTVSAERAVVAEALSIFGKSFNPAVQTASYSAATYPAVSIYSAAAGEGAFWQTGQRIVWLGNDQVAPGEFWRDVVVGGFRQYQPTAPFDGVSQLDWSHSFTFVGTNHQDAELVRQDFAGAQLKSDVSAQQLVSYYDQYPSRYKQDYDLNSTSFMGTTSRMFSFWNSTMQMLENMPVAYYQNGNIVLEFDARNNAPGGVHDLVWRFPGFSPFGDSLRLRTVTSNQTGWSVTNQSSKYVHYEASTATGKTRIVANYGTGLTSFEVSTSPAGLKDSFAVDGVECPLSPCSYEWAPGSTHNLTAATTTAPADGSRFLWSSWGDKEGRTFLVSAHFAPENLTAHFDLQYLLTVASGCSSSGEGWYTTGTIVLAGSVATCNRSGGQGLRISSYVIDGTSETPILSSTDYSVHIGMNAPHNVSFVPTTQYYINMDPQAVLDLYSITPPTLPGGRYWYDNGTQITLVFKGIYSRTDSETIRLASFTLGKGTATTIADTGNVTVLNGYPLHSPLDLVATLAKQYSVIILPNPPVSGVAAVETLPSIPGDVGWYDAGTQIVLKASPNGGWEFEGWAGTVVLTPSEQYPTLNVTVSGVIRETANFRILSSPKTSTTTSHNESPQEVITNLLPIVAVVLLIAISGFVLLRSRGKSQGASLGTPNPTNPPIVRG